jgi:hypothetical protein
MRFGLVLLVLVSLLGSASAQCPPGIACTEYLGKGSRGSYFRILVPENWDGDLILANHGLDLDPLSIQPHDTCKGDPTRACTSNAQCAGVGPGVCNVISLLGFDTMLLPKGKAVGASTYSETTWAVFESRFDLKDMIRFMTKRGPGRPKRVIATGFSGGGGVTVDAIMRLTAGKLIHGAIPMCPASAGGLPLIDTSTDFRLVYDYLCDDVPGGNFTSLPDVGDFTMTQVEFALRVNTCLGLLGPSADPVEAAAQAARRDMLFALTKFSGSNIDLFSTLGFPTLAMGDFVNDPRRLNGRRPGWNEGLDYTPVVGAEVDAAIERFGRGPGRDKMAKNTRVDFTRGNGKRVNYPIMAFAGTTDYIVIPEFQKVFMDTAALGGKDLAMIWGSTPGHCVYTSFEMTAVVDAYFDWLDHYGTVNAHKPTTADVRARCLSLPGASPAQCNFDTDFKPLPLTTRVPARPDWYEAARDPLP